MGLAKNQKVYNPDVRLVPPSGRARKPVQTKGDHGEVVGGEFSVAGSDPAVLLEPADQPLDLVALAIGLLVKVELWGWSSQVGIIGSVRRRLMRRLTGGLE